MKHFFKILKITFLVSFVFITGTSFSQDGCGYDEALKEALKDTNFLKKYVKEQSLINQQVKKIQASGVKTRNIITIPVVVHILYRKQDGDANLIYDRVKSQIDILNKHFNATDPVAINNSHPYYKSDFAANCQFNFVLANKDPNGKPTTGIVRKRINSYLDDDLDYCNSATGGSTAWDTYKYLNIYVLPKLKDDNAGVYYPSVPGDLTDVVFVKDSCFGEGSEDPNFNYGATCSHEVGHWLSLEHIWGDRFTIFGRDLIYDTPSHIDNSFNLDPDGNSLYACGGTTNNGVYPNNPDASPYLIGTNSSTNSIRHVSFDDEKKCGLASTSWNELNIFYEIEYNTNSSTYTTNGKFIDYKDSTNYVIYKSNAFNNLSFYDPSIKEIIKTKDGKFYFAKGGSNDQGGVYRCELQRNSIAPYNLVPETITKLSSFIGNDFRNCLDLTFDENNNIYAAFGYNSTGNNPTTYTSGLIGKWIPGIDSWQYTSVGLPPDEGGFREVENIHCDTINHLLYTITNGINVPYDSVTNTPPYSLPPVLSVHDATSLNFLNQMSLQLSSIRDIITDKNGRIWIAYFGSSGGSEIMVYDYNGTFNLLFGFEYPSTDYNFVLAEKPFKYDGIDNLYISFYNALVIINKASAISSANQIVPYTSSTFNPSENYFEKVGPYSCLAFDDTYESLYYGASNKLYKMRIPYKGNLGGRMYNNLMDYIKPNKNATIFTNGQNERMHATFDTKRLNLQSSDGYIAGGYCPLNQNLAKVGLAKVTNLTCKAVKLRWDKNPCVDKYHLRYRISTPQGSWIFINNIPSNKTSYVLNPNNSSLAPNTTYEYQIISVKAGFSNISSDLGSFKTLSAPCRNEEEENEDDLSVGENEMMIYPNPNSGKFNISYSFEDESDILVKIINMYGQVLYESNRPYDPFTNTIEINADLPAGYYIVSITNDNSSLNKGIIISR